MSADFPYVLKHVAGPENPCGGRAFFMRRKPTPGDVMRSADAAHLDGRPMEPDCMRCDTCGGIVWPHTSHVVPVGLPASNLRVDIVGGDDGYLTGHYAPLVDPFPNGGQPFARIVIPERSD